MKSNFKEFLSILDSALEPPDDPMFRPKKTVVTYNLNKPKWFYPSLTAAYPATYPDSCSENK